jgi:AGZA family xanthine/uracil permease-like MFS transporter
MMRGLVDINWMNHGEAIPAFVTIALMPLTYRSVYGVGCRGLGSILDYRAYKYDPHIQMPMNHDHTHHDHTHKPLKRKS